MDILELDDIQGYIIRGYSNQQYSRFVLLKITNAAIAKQWLKAIVDSITPATHIHDKSKLPETSLNIAFTCPGLKALDMVEENINSFNLEFSLTFTKITFGLNASKLWRVISNGSSFPAK